MFFGLLFLTLESWLWCCGSVNVTRASINIRVICKWVKFKLWVNYPFKPHEEKSENVQACHSVWTGSTKSHDPDPHKKTNLFPLARSLSLLLH